VHLPAQNEPVGIRRDAEQVTKYALHGMEHHLGVEFVLVGRKTCDAGGRGYALDVADESTIQIKDCSLEGRGSKIEAEVFIAHRSSRVGDLQAVASLGFLTRVESEKSNHA
jgi:hypothetical protein